MSGTPSTDPRMHGATLVFTLPADKNVGFIYHGKTKSDFALGTGEAVVSRNSTALTFDPTDTGVADSYIEVRRTKLPGQNAYEYTVSFKKPAGSCGGALEPDKLALRIDGKDYSVTPTGSKASDPVPAPLPPAMVPPSLPTFPPGPTPQPMPMMVFPQMPGPVVPPKADPPAKNPFDDIGGGANPIVVPKKGPNTMNPFDDIGGGADPKLVPKKQPGSDGNPFEVTPGGPKPMSPAPKAP